MIPTILGEISHGYQDHMAGSIKLDLFSLYIYIYYIYIYIHPKTCPNWFWFSGMLSYFGRPRTMCLRIGGITWSVYTSPMIIVLDSLGMFGMYCNVKQPVQTPLTSLNSASQLTISLFINPPNHYTGIDVRSINPSQQGRKPT